MSQKKWKQQCALRRLLWRDPELKRISFSRLRFGQMCEPQDPGVFKDNPYLERVKLSGFCCNKNTDPDGDFRLTGGILGNIVTLSSLKYLSLTDCMIRDISFLEHISSNGCIETLILRHNSIQDPSPIAFLPRLKVLSLCSNPLKSFRFVTGMGGLMSLDFSDTAQALMAQQYDKDYESSDLDLGDTIREGTVSFADLSFLDPCLVELKVSNTGMIDGDLQYIRHLTNLKHLDLSNNPIGDFRVFAGRAFDYLDVSMTNVKDPANFHGLTAKSLHMNSCDIVDSLVEERAEESATHLSPSCDHPIPKNVLHLTLNSSFTYPKERLQGLLRGSYHTLTNLELSCCDISDVRGFENMVNLKRLCLSSNDLSDITPLGGCTSLQKLYLTNNYITDDSVHILSGLPHLKDVICAHNYLTRIPLFYSADGSGYSTNLRYLCVSDCNITSSGLSEAYRLTSLRHLDLGCNHFVNVSHLSSLVNLRILSLGNNNNLADIRPLASLTSLKKLHLEGTQADLSQMPNFATAFPCLKELHLRRMEGRMEDYHLVPSMGGLEFLRGVTSLEMISVDNISAEGARILTTNPNLTDFMSDHFPDGTNIELDKREEAIAVVTQLNRDNKFNRLASLFQILLPFL